MSSLATHITLISDRIRELERGTFQAGIHHTFAITRCHYAETINLEAMSQGYASGYEVEELEKIEDGVASLSQDLVNRIADTVLPRRGN
jgi:hypothetical protein